MHSCCVMMEHVTLINYIRLLLRCFLIFMVLDFWSNTQLLNIFCFLVIRKSRKTTKSKNTISEFFFNIIWLCHYFVQCFMSPDNRGTRDLLHIRYTWANGSLYSTADDNKWKILLFIFSVLFVKTFRCFVSLCIHTVFLQCVLDSVYRSK